jgi:SAM-dependent methyltransferase
MMLKHAAKQVLGKSRSDAISYRRRLAAYGEAYLKPLGWDRSVVSRQAENRDGPVPWITYPALRMLERVVQPHFKVFEYGAGNSSLWWAARVAEVVAVEHDPIWAELVATRAPANLRVLARTMGGRAAEPGATAVAAFLAAHPDPPVSGDEARDIADGLVWAPFAAYLAELACYPAGWFDVVVVDGMARAPAAAMAARLVAPDGLVVFDNADRWQYNAGYDALAAAGFARLDFYGTRPVLVDESCTAIFTRSLDWARVAPTIARGRPSDLQW